MEESLYSELVSSRELAELMSRIMWWATILWLAAVGGCIGSFLNVVWDRWGTGKGIVFRPSHCVECGHRIRWYHNIPVIGWLILRGRCYDCGAPIPIKHPYIEAAFAVTFAAIGAWLLAR